MTAMSESNPLPAELLALSYRKEQVAARRLALRDGLSPDAALHRILQQVAGGAALDDLLAQRRRAFAYAADVLAQRRAIKALQRAAKLAQKQPDPTAWHAWFDGSSHPNPGRMHLGGLLRSPDGRRIEISRAAGQGESNEAECLALIAVLQAALAEGADALLVFGDSRVVIDGIAGAGSTRALAGHEAEVRSLLARLGRVRLCWIPRHQNAATDALSQPPLP